MPTENPDLSIPGLFPENLRSIGEELSKKYSFETEIARGRTGVAYKLKNRTMSSVPIEWGLVRILPTAFYEAFQQKHRSVQKTDIVVDVPYGKGSHDPIIVKDVQTGVESNITGVSHFSPSIFSQPAAYVSPIRVYVAPALHEQTHQSLGSIIADAEERFFASINKEGVPESGTDVV